MTFCALLKHDVVHMMTVHYLGFLKVSLDFHTMYIMTLLFSQTIYIHTRTHACVHNIASVCHVLRFYFATDNNNTNQKYADHFFLFQILLKQNSVLLKTLC